MTKRWPDNHTAPAPKVRGWRPHWTVLTLLMNCAIPATLAIVCLATWSAMAQEPGSIQGKVADPSDSPIYGAVVVIEDAQGGRHPTVTDADGTFRISSLAPGDYSVKISATGFSEWTASNVPASATPDSNPLSAVLDVAPQVTALTVGLPPDEVATEQVTQQLKQRTLKVLPNYYVSYEEHPAPLPPQQKLRLASRLLLDPAMFLGVGTLAGIEQAHNSYYQWGQGSKGYAKRFGADYAAAAQDLLFTSVIADSLLHQDPRYFYSGRGSVGRRAWYAVESAFLTKGDNGKWQPPYAGVIGAIASEELATTYFPGSRSQASLVGRAMAFHFGGLVVMNMFQEFVMKGLTSHKPVDQSRDVTVLQEGTAVRLIAVNGLSAEKAESGRTVTFVLAEDLTAGGKRLAETGDVATGLVDQVSRPEPAGEATSVTLKRALLQVGNVTVPLRSSQVRGVDGPMQYRELPESGKVEVMLFVAQDVQLPEVQ